MVYEYALEPELVATWGNPDRYKFVVDKFGIGTSRIVSAYPKNWARIAYEACNTEDDIEKEMLVEIIYQLQEKMIVRRESDYDSTLSWLECAEREHQRLPFKAILASQNPRQNEVVIPYNQLGMTKNDRRWESAEFPTLREAKSMAKAIEPMLSNCREVVFVDPYFAPSNPKKRKPLQEFLKSIMKNRKSDITRLDVITKYDEFAEFFEKQCLNILPSYVPQGLILNVLRISERKGKEQIHNRYVLSDIGGVNFGAGLDEGKENQTDDVGLLKINGYEMRWRQYSTIAAMKDSLDRTFDLIGEPIRIMSNMSSDKIQ